jgi:hypothetical protein
MAEPVISPGRIVTAGGPVMVTGAPVMVRAPVAVMLMTGDIRLIEPFVMFKVLAPTLRVMLMSASVEIAILTCVV